MVSCAAQVTVMTLSEPAVDVKQKARPARHDEPIVVSPPANGIDRSAPIVYLEFPECSL